MGKKLERLILKGDFRGKGKGLSTFLFLLAIYVSPAASQSIRWERIGGAYGGVVYSVATAPDGLVLAGTRNTGLYISKNNGQTWDRNSLDVFSVTDIAISGDGDIYLATSYRIYRSTNNGELWIQLPIVSSSNNIWCTAVDSSGNVYVGTYGGGVFKSSDKGARWNQLFDLKGQWVQTIKVAPNGTIFAGTSQGLYRSVNGGNSWGAVSGIPPKWVYSLAFGPGSEVFIAHTFGVYKSLDNGIKWTLATQENSCAITCFSILRVGEGTVMAGTGIGIIRSSDKGDTWSLDRLEQGENALSINSLVKGNDGMLLAATDGIGVLSSIDSGVTWTCSSHGLSASPIFSLAVQSSGELFAGTGETIFVSTDRGQEWIRRGPVSRNSNFHSIRIRPEGSVYGGALNGGVARSEDKGVHWTWANNGLPRSGEQPGMYSFQVDFLGRLYASTTHGLYRSADKGESWVGTGSSVRLTWLAPEVNGNLLFGNQQGVFRSSDGGSHWIQLQSTPAVEFSAMTSNSVGHLFGIKFVAPGAYGLVRSTDLGESWNMMSSFPFWISTLTTTRRGDLLATTNGNGVFISTDQGTSWKAVNEGLENLRIGSICEDNRGYLYAGSLFGGIFRTVLPVTSVAHQVESIPSNYVLEQNHPNPFNPTTEIRFSLPKTSNVKLVIFDVMGRTVATLVDGVKEAGAHRAMWNGRRDDGQGASSGVYFYHIQAEGFTATKKLTLIK